MRRSGKGEAIIFLLLVIVLLAVAAGGVSNLKDSVDKAFNNGGAIGTTQTTGNGTTIVPVTTNVPVTTKPVVTTSLHTHVYLSTGYCLCGDPCSHDNIESYLPYKEGTHYIINLCKICGHYEYKEPYKAVVCEDWDYDGYCNFCYANLNVHVCVYDYDNGVVPDSNNPHYVVYPCENLLCQMFDIGETPCEWSVIGKEAVCKICGDTCSHGSITPEYGDYLNNSQHSVDEKCNICGCIVYAGPAPCYDDNGDGYCDICGEYYIELNPV